jgi:Sulfotransferase domain
MCFVKWSSLRANYINLLKNYTVGKCDRNITVGQNKRQIPDFVIVGTMKGGTTALYDFITMHPDVEKASKKEIHYFTLHYHKGCDWYLAHFGRSPNKLTGEASPTYFDITNSTLVPTLIKNFNPNVKILLIIRDPIERALSQFNHLCKVNKIQTLLSMDVNEFFNIPLSQAIADATVEGYHLGQVIYFSTYYRKYMHYKSVFDSSNILVITNKGLKEAPFETMRNVYNFIGVKPIELKEFVSFRYSAGTNIDMLNDRTYDRLAEMLYPDYSNFCKASGIEYSELNMRE